jgi:hypothetical protein
VVVGLEPMQGFRAARKTGFDAMAHPTCGTEGLLPTPSRPSAQAQASDFTRYRRKNSKLSVVSIISRK